MSDQPSHTWTPPEAKTTANHYDKQTEVLSGDEARNRYETEAQKEEAEKINKGKVIDLAWCLNFFGKRGREAYGEKFKIHEEDHEIIYKLIIYFLAHEAEANRLGLDLRKGILLTGPVGCGKTSLMNLMRLIPPIERQYIMKPCRDISFEFIKEGYEVIDRYSKLSFNTQHPKAYCFDDLGAEQSLKYYGNECNIMAEILLSRYDLFISSHMQTHLTTNLSASELEQAYGLRVRSRLREMFNLLSFSEAKDKRT